MQLGEITGSSALANRSNLIDSGNSDCLLFSEKKKDYQQAELSRAERSKGNRWKREVGSNKGQSFCLLLSCLPESVDRTLQCALCPGGAGRVAEYRDRGSEGERRRAGLAGCGLKWQQIVLDHSNPFNSTGKLQLVARGASIWRGNSQVRASSRASESG